MRSFATSFSRPLGRGICPHFELRERILARGVTGEPKAVHQTACGLWAGQLSPERVLAFLRMRNFCIGI